MSVGILTCVKARARICREKEVGGGGGDVGLGLFLVFFDVAVCCCFIMSFVCAFVAIYLLSFLILLLRKPRKIKCKTLNNTNRMIEFAQTNQRNETQCFNWFSSFICIVRLRD